jgi:hypothetical protein
MFRQATYAGLPDFWKKHIAYNLIQDIDGSNLPVLEVGCTNQHG